VAPLTPGRQDGASSRASPVPDILETLRPFGDPLAIKLYRMALAHPPGVPILPCLDHEAMLHQQVAPHVAVYLQERATGDLHELIFVPDRRRIDVDTVSTWGESSPGARARLTSMLADRFAGWRVRVIGPSRWRADGRVAAACHAQVPLRDVLLDPDVADVAARVSRLQMIGALMEKQSRVASWGVRTVTGPLLPAAGVLTYFALGSLSDTIGTDLVALLRYAVVGLLGSAFLYYGLKAVQLTDMANRVWKRSAEYSLILAERRRLEQRSEEQGHRV